MPPFISGLLFAVFFTACSRLDPPGPEQPLVVGLPADPAFLQAAPGEGLNGFTHDMVGLFAESIHAGVRFVTVPDYRSLLAQVREGKVHMAATLPVSRADTQLAFTPPVRETRQVIVRHAGGLPADSLLDLAGHEIAVMPGAPQIQTLKTLKVDPPPRLVERTDIDEIGLLAAVARRRHDLAASDDLHFALAANAHPDLDIALELPGKLAYAWAFPIEENVLRDKATALIERARQDGTLRRLDDRYFGHIRRLKAPDIAEFLDKTRSRLPEHRPIFHEAQELTGIDWRLLAALAYQESKWDPLATSPTGVRGMMMLTEETADRLKVSNRLDTRQSIRAGANYLVLLMDELPNEIKPPDRLWFALAAYNLGLGHLNGGRHFAPSLKRDPNLWVDMKQVLPLLARPEYYTRLKSGRARGGEAVIMVENIRNYYDVLSRIEPMHTPPSVGGEKPQQKPKKKAGKPAKVSSKRR
jgi:membrane-bound lytic murein transglycosylase F